MVGLSQKEVKERSEMQDVHNRAEVGVARLLFEKTEQVGAYGNMDN
jgi:hypothetical protein